jgi:hypothetical protein
MEKSTILSEFKGFLTLNPDKKFLLFNLQDKVLAAKSRSETLEQSDGQLPNLSVVSIPKDTSFYHQDHEYFDLSQAAAFMKALYDQVQGAPMTGFSFPKEIDVNTVLRFSQKIVPWIHRQFFAQNETLTRKNRQDFIEIFYGFLIFKIVELVNPDYLSMSCKDALDIGSLGNLQLYAFLKIFSGNKEWKAEEKDKILELALVPAFINRSRMVLINRFHRMHSMFTVLEQIETLNPKALKELTALYPGLKIHHLEWVEEAA